MTIALTYAELGAMFPETGGMVLNHTARANDTCFGCHIARFLGI